MPHLLCQICGKTCSANTLQWRCTCGGPFDLHFEAELIVDALPHRPPTLWRYREAIPIKDNAHIVTLDEGFTPLTPVTIAGKSLLVKQDHLFPSGSYKDRGATVLISHAHALGVQNMVEDSSGNAGAAVAAYAARAGNSLATSTFPTAHQRQNSHKSRAMAQPFTKSQDRGKIRRAQFKTRRKNTFMQAMSGTHFSFKAPKHYAYEIWEQNNFNAPDTLIIPTGNGTLLIGAYIGFTDLLKQNLIDPPTQTHRRPIRPLRPAYAQLDGQTFHNHRRRHRHCRTRPRSTNNPMH